MDIAGKRSEERRTSLMEGADSTSRAPGCLAAIHASGLLRVTCPRHLGPSILLPTASIVRDMWITYWP